MIGDISEPKERGGFYGVYALGPMVRIKLTAIVRHWVALVTRRVVDWSRNWSSNWGCPHWLIGLEVVSSDSFVPVSNNSLYSCCQIHILVHLYFILCLSTDDGIVRLIFLPLRLCAAYRCQDCFQKRSVS